MNLRHFVVLWICFIFQLAQAFVVLPQGSTTAFGVLSSRSTRSASSSSSLLRVAQDNNFDMEELRQRIRQESVPQLFDSPNTNEHKVEDVFVILFRPGTHEQGAHTIEYPPGSGNNMILAFASLEACNKFAESLKLQNFFEKTFVDPMVRTSIQTEPTADGVLTFTVPLFLTHRTSLFVRCSPNNLN
jgi:hypothetical protein